MIIDFIQNNIQAFVLCIWIIFVVIVLILLAKTTKKNSTSEKKAFRIVLNLILCSIFVVMYVTNFGTTFLKNIISNLGIKNMTIFTLIILCMYLLFKTFRLNIKLQTLNNKIEKMDQRYSINENHLEYQKRKNNHKIYRSQ